MQGRHGLRSSLDLLRLPVERLAQFDEFALGGFELFVSRLEFVLDLLVQGLQFAGTLLGSIKIGLQRIDAQGRTLPFHGVRLLNPPRLSPLHLKMLLERVDLLAGFVELRLQLRGSLIALPLNLVHPRVHGLHRGAVLTLASGSLLPHLIQLLLEARAILRQRLNPRAKLGLFAGEPLTILIHRRPLLVDRLALLRQRVAIGLDGLPDLLNFAAFAVREFAERLGVLLALLDLHRALLHRGCDLLQFVGAPVEFDLPVVQSRLPLVHRLDHRAALARNLAQPFETTLDVRDDVQHIVACRLGSSVGLGLMGGVLGFVRIGHGHHLGGCGSVGERLVVVIGVKTGPLNRVRREAARDCGLSRNAR